MAAPVLRPYQDRWIDQIREALKRCRRVLGTAPTGSGKTVAFCWLARAVAANAKRILILGHRQEIVDQVSRMLTAFAIPHGIIAPDYPETVAAVQVAVVLTLANRLHTYAGAFDLIIVDEGHHSVANSWKRIFAAFHSAYIIGVTATPERLDGKPLKHLYDELILGPSVRELVEDGWLSPLVTFAPPTGPDLSGLRVRAGDYEAEALAQRMMGSGRLTGNAVAHYTKLAPQLPGLAYGVSVEHSKSIAAAFCRAGYTAIHVDSDTPKDERRAAIEALGAGRLDLLTNCMLFTEAVDLPALGIVLLLRPTKSLALYLQMIGRAARPAPGKRRAIVLDHAGNSVEHGLYDFPHAWSLEGRPKVRIPIRQCPECGAVLEIRATECPECGHRFVQALTPMPPRIPQTIPGELERVDDGLMRQLRVTTRGGTMPYRRLLGWIGRDPERAELARRANGYQRGWIRYVLEEAA